MKSSYKTMLVFVVAAGMVTAACEKDIPVDWIGMDPGRATLFVGESIPVTITCEPENATNVDELLVYSSNESIITWSDGVVTARDAGRAALTATCGNVLAQSIIKVYRDKIDKGGASYGIDYATGYQYLMGGSTVQEIEIILIHEEPGEPTQNFKIWLKTEQLGKDLDYTKPLDGSFVGVYANNNENGYLVYSSSEGTPFIVLADWTFVDDVTLTRGILRVDDLSGYRYRVHADFELSNGYAFGTDWEGIANMSVE